MSPQLTATSSRARDARAVLARPGAAAAGARSTRSRRPPAASRTTSAAPAPPAPTAPAFRVRQAAPGRSSSCRPATRPAAQTAARGGQLLERQAQRSDRRREGDRHRRSARGRGADRRLARDRSPSRRRSPGMPISSSRPTGSRRSMQPSPSQFSLTVPASAIGSNATFLISPLPPADRGPAPREPSRPSSATVNHLMVDHTNYFFVTGTDHEPDRAASWRTRCRAAR